MHYKSIPPGWSEPLPQKLMDGAYIRLENMIVTGVLKPGQWVSEIELVKLSGFSRAPVRSAIQRLSDQLLLATYPKRGTQVCPIDYTLQFRSLELRRVVERLLIISASQRANQEQRRKFTQLSKEIKIAGMAKNQDQLTELDYHGFILTIEAADNPFAAKAMITVKGLSRRFWILYHEKHGDIIKSAIAYANIAQAISDGSPKKAGRAADTLIDYMEQFTMEVVGYNPKLSESI